MTKREPFEKPKDHFGETTEMIREPFAVELHGGMRVAGVNIIQDRNPMMDIYLVKQINAAFESAVAERVKEAVAAAQSGVK